MRSALIIVVSVIVLVLAGVFFFGANEDANTTNSANQTVNRTANTSNTSSLTNREGNVPANESAGTTTNEDDRVSSSAISVTATSVVPSVLNVPAGTTVTWTNDSGSTIFIAPDNHPTHVKYQGVWDDDGTGRISDGETYAFTFTIPGTYTWHNHLNPSVIGTVIVK